MAAIGFTMGVILGGILTSTFSWHWVFFVNVPIGAFVFLAGLATIPDPGGHQKKRGFDVSGAVLVTSSLLFVIYAITQSSSPGETPFDLAVLLVLSAGLAASFIYVERKAYLPPVPFDVFRRRLIALSDLIMFLAYGANAIVVFIISLFIQEVRGYSPLETGLLFIPVGLGGITGAIIAPRIIGKVGFRIMILAGLLMFGSGCRTGDHRKDYPILILTVYYYFAAVGIVSTIVSLNIAGTTGIVAERQGLAAGLLTTSQQIGAAIGVSACRRGYHRRRAIIRQFVAVDNRRKLSGGPVRIGRIHHLLR